MYSTIPNKFGSASKTSDKVVLVELLGSEFDSFSTFNCILSGVVVGGGGRTGPSLRGVSFVPQPFSFFVSTGAMPFSVLISDYKNQTLNNSTLKSAFISEIENTLP